MRATTDNLVPSSEWLGSAGRVAALPRPGHTAAECLWWWFARPGGIRSDTGRPDEQSDTGGPARNLQRPAHQQLE